MWQMPAPVSLTMTGTDSSEAIPAIFSTMPRAIHVPPGLYGLLEELRWIAIASASIISTARCHPFHTVVAELHNPEVRHQESRWCCFPDNGETWLEGGVFQGSTL